MRNIMIQRGGKRTRTYAFLEIGILIVVLASCTHWTGVSTTKEKSALSRKSNIIDYVGNYKATLYPQRELKAFFTTNNITVDGIVDTAYADALESVIDNFKVKTDQTDYVYAVGSEPGGVLRALWDGPMLYLLVQVRDATPMRGTRASEGAMTIKPAIPADCDSVQFGFDLYNDKVPYETDTIGMFTVGSNGALYFYRNPGIPSLGSVMADPIHPEYMNRIKSYAAHNVYAADGATVIGYNVEVALHIEKTKLENGRAFGIDVSINDVADNVTLTTQNRDGAARRTTGPTRVGISFWSHRQNNLYADFDAERPNAVDWGNVTLAGWDGKRAFKFSNWRLISAVGYLDSIAFPKGVYTKATQTRLDTARSKADRLIQTSLAGAREKAKIDAAAEQLEAAIAGLRWADTRYPDPADLPIQNTPPNPYKFFGSNRLVKSASDWKERRAEILNLAQFYEYGYKPDQPDSIEVTQIKHVNIGDDVLWFTWNGKDNLRRATSPQEQVTVRITVGAKTAELKYTVYLPTDEQRNNLKHAGRRAPIVLSFDGDNEAYRKAGYVVVETPSGSGGDARTNEYAWGDPYGRFLRTLSIYPQWRGRSPRSEQRDGRRLERKPRHRLI